MNKKNIVILFFVIAIWSIGFILSDYVFMFENRSSDMVFGAALYLITIAILDKK